MRETLPAAPATAPTPARLWSLDARVLAIWRRINRCRVCPTIEPWRKFPLGRRGTTRFGLMILGEAPGRVSLDHGRPFSNPRNLVIRRAIARAIAPAVVEAEQLFYFSDTVKCWPSSPTAANRSPRAAETAECVVRHLKPELDLVRPRVIFAFGALAANAAIGRPIKLLEMHGKPIATDTGLRIIPMTHPSTINIAGMRRVGINSLEDYELQMCELIRFELDRAGIKLPAKFSSDSP